MAPDPVVGVTAMTSAAQFEGKVYAIRSEGSLGQQEFRWCG